MRQGFRPLLQPPRHRCAKTDIRRPGLCLALSSSVLILFIVIFGVTAWNISEHWFGRNSLIFHSGDEVALSQVATDLSVTFCDGYRVSLQGRGQIFLLPHRATVNTSFSDNLPVEMDQPAYREFNVQYLYLLKQSRVNVTACRGSGVTSPRAYIALIQGNDNFRRWREDSYCDDCVLARVDIPQGAHCDKKYRPLKRLFHQVESNDRYFLVIFNGRPGLGYHRKDSFIYLSGHISRTHFDLRDAQKACYMLNNSDCYFELPWMSRRDVVVKFEGLHWRDYRSTLITQCTTRVIFWVCLFGILPLGLIILASVVFGCFLCRPRTSKVRVAEESRGERDGERERLLPDKDGQRTENVPEDEDNGSMSIQLG